MRSRARELAFFVLALAAFGAATGFGLRIKFAKLLEAVAVLTVISHRVTLPAKSVGIAEVVKADAAIPERFRVADE